VLGERDVQPEGGRGSVKLGDSEKVMAVSPIGFAKPAQERVRGKGGGSFQRITLEKTP